MLNVVERIEWLEKAIKTLENWQTSNHEDEVNRIINLAEYKDELKQLNIIKKENASLFR